MIRSVIRAIRSEKIGYFMPKKFRIFRIGYPSFLNRIQIGIWSIRNFLISDISDRIRMDNPIGLGLFKMIRSERFDPWFGPSPSEKTDIFYVNKYQIFQIGYRTCFWSGRSEWTTLYLSSPQLIIVIVPKINRLIIKAF